MARLPKTDKFLLLLVLTLVTVGLFIFISASFGLLARDGRAFLLIAARQVIFGLAAGGLLAFVVSRTPHNWWRKNAFWFLSGAIFLNLLLFAPGLAVEHGGARRWLEVFWLSFQPSEFLKLGVILYFAAWLGKVKGGVATVKHGLLPLFILLAVSAAIILSQPDTDTFIVLAAALVSMFMAAGGRWRHFLVVFFIAGLSFVLLISARPYLTDRLKTFIDPAADPLGAGYQIQQSIIAVGSGEIFGRGFGRSVQKFGYLPEPRGDSIFAVAAEEFGFIGSAAIVVLFTLFALRGFWVARRAPDFFAAYTTIGIVTIIIFQSFLNIAAMVGLVPLSGMPLIFISHGGTALFVSLIEVGIILSISRHLKAG